MGHGLTTSEQGGEQVPMLVRYVARKGENRSEVLQDALGAFLETARASSKPCNRSYGAETESKNRERSSEIGSAALRPLHAR